MKTETALLILLAGLVLAADATARVLVATNSTWRYFKGTSEASSPTNAWRELAFDDSTWLIGAAPFHFGTNSVGGDDGQTGGTILSDMRSNYTCIFLRQTFVIEDTNQLQGLVLNAWVDDGFAVWINGRRPRAALWVSGSSLACTNTASTTREANTRTGLDISSGFSTLRNGTNVLCLQAFNGHLTNDDFRIEVELTEAPPSLAFAMASTNLNEDADQVVLTVLRKGSLEVVTVAFATTNGTALSGQDYLATNGTLTFAEGQTEQSIVVSLLHDALVETTETFQVKLSNPGGGAVLGTEANATIFIADSAKLFAHHFTRIVKQSDGTIAVALDGMVPSSMQSFFDLYVLETTTNLKDWTPLVTLLRSNLATNEVVWIEPNASLLEKRFYRTFTNHLITPFPKPTGPFAIGTFSRVITDPARTNWYRYNNQTNSFMLTCWYPAEPQTGLLPGGAWDSKLCQDVGMNPQLKGHSLPNAPMARGTNRYPIILYSHGLNTQRKSNCHEAEELASHGYVVAGVDHEDCWGIEFPDGRYLRTSYSSPSAYLIDSRLKDLICAMDELGRLDASDPWLAGRLDFNCLGTLGMSFGGSSTANLCRTNQTVKCAAFLDAAFHFEWNVQLNLEGLQKPFLAMNNNNSSEPEYVFWPESAHLFDLATSNATIFQIANTRHFSFFDFAWFYPSQYAQSRVMDACLVSFFNKHLKGQDDHLLDQVPPTFPDENFEVVNFMNK